jgi:spoIIIJ-associated protein
MDKKETLKNTLTDILNYIGVRSDFTIEETQSNSFKVIVKGDNLNFLIGYRGQSLDALQVILSQILYNKSGEWASIIVDINDYKDKRTDKLQEIAKKYIDKVRFFQSDYELPSMKPWERKKIHEMISEYDDIVSESTGEEPNRRIVLKPKVRK